jgi:hypothetical protein
VTVFARIRIHQHVIPPVYRKLLEDRSLTAGAGRHRAVSHQGMWRRLHLVRLIGLLTLGACTTGTSGTTGTSIGPSSYSQEKLDAMANICRKFRNVPYDQCMQKLSNSVATSKPQVSGPEPFFTPGPGKTRNDYSDDRIACSSINSWTTQGFTDCMIARGDTVEGGQASPMTQAQRQSYTAIPSPSSATSAVNTCGNFAGPSIVVRPNGLLDTDKEAMERYGRCGEDFRRNASVGCLDDALEHRSRGLPLVPPGQFGQVVTARHPVTPQERQIYVQCMAKNGYHVSGLPNAYEHPSW